MQNDKSTKAKRYQGFHGQVFASSALLPVFGGTVLLLKYR